MSLQLDSIVHQSPEPLIAAVDEVLVLFSPTSGRYFTLDDITTRIWHHLETPLMVADVCERLQREFEVDRSRCQTDVLRVLEQLAERGLVTTNTA